LRNNNLNLYERIFLFKDLVYIFFRLDSIHNYLEQENVEIKLDYVDREQNYQRLISKTLLSLHKFLKEKDIDGWIKSLTESSSVKTDSNGQFFTYINLYAAEYYKNGSLTEEQKNKFNNKIKSYADHYKIKLKDKPEKILLEMKNKIELAMELYKKIVELEVEFSNLASNDQLQQFDRVNKSNKVIIKILLKHALKYLERESLNINNSNDLKSQIELAIELMENDEFDCSSINIFNINSEVIRSLKILFDNLVLIPNRAHLRRRLKKLMIQTLGFDNAYDYRQDKYARNQINYFKPKFDAICKGNLLFI
jgi:hypothetical protein